eukprot:TRINITY_DN1869_c0_g3_i10.p1 TRINITY_DN1869_c0_g3~~TRINITY_DN1869_c0_g3_i10.p1  ORF type:complete len:283 (+),score=37.49 TRINITY_DN1869_c0_g3_i10:45-851(+)
MEDRFSQVPGEILDIIFLDCDVKDTPSLSLVCKKFRSRIDTERMWKERSIALWNENIGQPISDLERIKEKVEILNWKKITKFLFNKKDGNYRYEWDKGFQNIFFKQYNADMWIPSKSVRVSFRPINKYIDFGEFLNCGNGYGISHKPEGTYIGQLDCYDRYGQGKMIWLDGFEYEGEWSNDRPEDWEKCIHPKIIECIERGTCTREASTQNHPLPQIMWRCEESYGYFCDVCHDNGCQGFNGRMDRRWFDWSFCSCKKEGCLKNKRTI